MREAQTKTIDGIKFHVQQMPAMLSMKTMYKLTAAFGPAMLRSLAGVPLEVKSLAKLDLGALAGGVEGILERFSADDLEKLIKTLLETAAIEIEEDKPVPLMRVFDVELAGKQGTILKLVKFALEVNYGDFFAAFRALLPAAERQ